MKLFSRGWGGAAVFTILAVVGPQDAFALPVMDGLTAPAAAFPFEDILPGATIDFTSIVALNNCSASLVRLENSLPDDKGMVMTNGHCKEGGFIGAGEVVVDQASSRSMNLLSSDGKTHLGKLRAERIIFGTMTKTDMMLYRLTDSYADIERRFGVRGLTLRSRHPDAGNGIAVVSGYWRRIYKCSIDRFVSTLKEDQWTFNDSIRYSKPGCETIGGTSGSPVLDTDTGEVVGINNTGSDDGAHCTMNNPCEVAADGSIVAEKGTSYGQQTFWIYGCMSTNNQLDLTRAGCELPR